MHNIFPSRNHQEISRTLPSSLLFDISTPEQYADGPNRSRRNGIAASKRRRSDINVEQRERASGEQSINFSKSGGYSGAADTKIRSWAPQSYATESPPRNVAALIDHREDALYPRVYVPHSATHPRTLPPIRSSSVVVDSSSQLSAFHPISSVSRVSPPRTINYTRLFYNTSSYDNPQQHSTASPPTPTRSVSSLTSDSSYRRLQTPDGGEAVQDSQYLWNKYSCAVTDMATEKQSERTNAKEFFCGEFPAAVPYDHSPRMELGVQLPSHGSAQVPPSQSSYTQSPKWPSSVVHQSPTANNNISHTTTHIHSLTRILNLDDGGNLLRGYSQPTSAGLISGFGEIYNSMQDSPNPAPPPVPAPIPPSTSSSLAHRRTALSLAGLLSPLTPPYGSPKSFPFPLQTTSIGSTTAKTASASVISSIPVAEDHQTLENPCSPSPAISESQELEYPTYDSPKLPPSSFSASNTSNSTSSTPRRLLGRNDDAEKDLPSSASPKLKESLPLPPRSISAFPCSDSEMVTLEETTTFVSTNPETNPTVTAPVPPPMAKADNQPTVTILEGIVDEAPMTRMDVDLQDDSSKPPVPGTVGKYSGMLDDSPEPFSADEGKEDELRMVAIPCQTEEPLEDLDEDLEGEALLKTKKRSRTLMVIQSDDEDSEWGEKKEHGLSFKKQREEKEREKVDPKFSSKKLTLKRNVGKKRIRGELSSLDLSTPNPQDPSPSPSTLASAVTVMSPNNLSSVSSSHFPFPVQCKRNSTKKGWKGWTLVAEDEVELAPKAFSLDKLPPATRSTRSGRQFN